MSARCWRRQSRAPRHHEPPAGWHRGSGPRLDELSRSGRRWRRPSPRGAPVAAPSGTDGRRPRRLPRAGRPTCRASGARQTRDVADAIGLVQAGSNRDQRAALLPSRRTAPDPPRETGATVTIVCFEDGAAVRGRLVALAGAAQNVADKAGRRSGAGEFGGWARACSRVVAGAGGTARLAGRDHGQDTPRGELLVRERVRAARSCGDAARAAGGSRAEILAWNEGPAALGAIAEAAAQVPTTTTDPHLGLHILMPEFEERMAGLGRNIAQEKIALVQVVARRSE